MYKTLKIVFVSSILVVILTAAINVLAGSKAESSRKLNFAVIGDLHAQTDDINRALKDLAGIGGNLDSLVLNGDIVDQGLDEQYQRVKTCVERNKGIVNGNIIMNIGNHEYYNFAKGLNTDAEVNEYREKFLRFSGEKNVYHDSWIKGYHFICIGSEKSFTKELGTVRAYISKEQLQWLEDKLAEGYKPYNPIFVFLHQPLNNSVMGSKYNYDAVMQDKEVRSMLSKYPEVILFTSHTHYSPGLPGSFKKQIFNMVDTGSVHNPLEPDINGKDVKVDGSHGLYVEVFKDKVIIRGRNFSKKAWTENAEFIVNYKRIHSTMYMAQRPLRNN